MTNQTEAVLTPNEGTMSKFNRTKTFDEEHFKIFEEQDIAFERRSIFEGKHDD